MAASKYIYILILILLGCSAPPSVPSLPNPALDWGISFNSSNVGKLVSPSVENDHSFGSGIVTGDWNSDGVRDLAIGAPAADIVNTDSGEVFIYYGPFTSTTVFTEPDLRITSNNINGSWFGAALEVGDLSGDGIDDLIIGAPLEDRVGGNSGSVYIYRGSASGIETSPWQIIDEPNLAANNGFGSSLKLIDLDNDTFKELIVGTIYNDTVATDSGAVWILQGKSDGIFVPTDNVRITRTGAAATDYFGQSVGVYDHNNDGNLDIYIGASRQDTGGTDRGSIYVYYGNSTAGSFVGSNTVPSVSINSPIAVDSIYFGHAMGFADIDNNGNMDLLVGNYGTDFGSSNKGSVTVLKNIRMNTTIYETINEPNFTTFDVFYGYGLSISDLNGDGVSDLIVAGQGDDTYAYNNGRVDVFFGSSSGAWDTTGVDKKFHSLKTGTTRYNSGDYFGSAVCAGDFNGDGKKDLAVGAYSDDDKYSADGGVFIYYTTGVVKNKPDLVLRTAGAVATSRGMGFSCHMFDYNRDGLDDLLIGAPYDDSGGTDAGAVYVFYSSSSGLGTTPGATLIDPGDDGNGFGSGIASGDINNDGFSDLVVGAMFDDTGGTDRGVVYVFESNNTTGVINVASSTVFQMSLANSEYFGASVALIDIDGDNDLDLLVGAPNNDTIAANSGRVVVYTNPGTTNTLLDTTADSYINDPTLQANNLFGYFIRAVNYTSTTNKDLFIGAPYDDVSTGNAGALYIYAGSATGPAASPTETILGLDGANSANEGLGFSADALDIDLDGDLDLAVGAFLDDETGIDSGSVYIIKK